MSILGLDKHVPISVNSSAFTRTKESDIHNKLFMMEGLASEVWAIDWGSCETNERGRMLLGPFVRLNVVLVNIIGAFQIGYMNSVIDLMSVTYTLS